MSGLVCWVVILIIVIIVVVCIILRLWYAIPHKLITTVISAYDIVRDFSRNTAKYLKSLLDIPHIEPFRLIFMEEINVMTVKGKVKLNDDLIKELIKKRLVIVCDDEHVKYANDLACKLVDINACVSLVIFGQSELDIDSRIHLIKVTSESIDISSGSK